MFCSNMVWVTGMETVSEVTDGLMLFLGVIDSPLF
jgi:hypothetical protein